MNIFITGNQGQLGRDCTAVLGRQHSVAGADLPDLDIADNVQMRQRLDACQPDWIVNCAAFTNVDVCETESAMAWRANAEGPRNLAVCARECGAGLIHISTDYVFDGRREPPQPYTEDDAPNPVSAYGRGKLAGEQMVRDHAQRWMILRTAWLYGLHGRNFPRTMLRLAHGDRRLRVVNDQFGSPTWSYTLAQQIARLLESNGQGLYHATAEEHTTWFDLAVIFLNLLDIPHAIAPCTSQDYPTPAQRPGNSILENRALKQAELNVFIDWREDLRRFVDLNRQTILDAWTT